MSHKTYHVLLTQQGTSDPVADELENTVGAATWRRGNQGEYILESVGGFAGRVSMLYTTADHVQGFTYHMLKGSDDALELKSFDSGNAADDVIRGITIEVRVYPI